MTQHKGTVGVSTLQEPQIPGAIPNFQTIGTEFLNFAQSSLTCNTNCWVLRTGVLQALSGALVAQDIFS